MKNNKFGNCADNNTLYFMGRNLNLVNSNIKRDQNVSKRRILDLSSYTQLATCCHRFYFLQILNVIS